MMWSSLYHPDTPLYCLMRPLPGLYVPVDSPVPFGLWNSFLAYLLSPINIHLFPLAHTLHIVSEISICMCFFQKMNLCYTSQSQTFKNASWFAKLLQ